MPNKRCTTGPIPAVLDEKVQSTMKKLIKDAINSWKGEYLKMIADLKNELSDVKNSQEFISAKYDELKVDYDKQIETNKKLENELKTLKNQIAENNKQTNKEAVKLDSLEQYGRRLNLEIAGIPFTEGENTNAIVTEVAELLDVKITDKDISTSHRLRSRNDYRPPLIIARFISRDVRNELYSKRKLTQGINLDQLSVKRISELYINENLTPFRKRLFWKAKQDAIKADYKFFWTVNGNIFVRKTENSKPLLITTEQDLNLMK